MKLSIIPIDGTVCKDGICCTRLSWEGTPPNMHALQWDADSGWIEFNDGKVNEPITTLPSWVSNAESAWNAAANPPPSPAPTPEELKAQNTAIASQLLQETDWVENPTVRNTSLEPHLANAAAFDAYRLELRKIAVNPPAGDIKWPTKPSAVWA